MNLIFHTRRLGLSYFVEWLLRFRAWRTARNAVQAPRPAPVNDPPQTPEDFRPLEDACFQDPYDFYRMLRDQYPVYQLANGIYCISRYDDIVSVSRNTERYSSKHQGAMLRVPPGGSIAKLSARLDALGEKGVLPSGVLATNDPPEHRRDRKIAQGFFSSNFVTTLEEDVASITDELMEDFLGDGKVEFMRRFAWQLPMRVVMKLLGVPQQELPTVKRGCVSSIALLSGSSTPAELMRTAAESQGFYRYCWRIYQRVRRQPGDNLIARFAAAAADSDNDFTDQHAVSVVHQLLLAGSDSAATTMGNAVKMMLERPEIETELRANPERIPAFIEEVLRLDSAFQGHFRWAKQDSELHGIALPRGSRIFLMWASGNRDERVWDDPGQVRLDRPNAGRHLTFGHGIHGCLGRELARLEIRCALTTLLERSSGLRVAGDAPFVASMFTRSLTQLPLEFTAVQTRSARALREVA